MTGISSYVLEGKGDLKQHEGHQVRITGRLVNEPASATRRISVESVEMVAANCQR